MYEDVDCATEKELSMIEKGKKVAKLTAYNLLYSRYATGCKSIVAGKYAKVTCDGDKITLAVYDDDACANKIDITSSLGIEQPALIEKGKCVEISKEYLIFSNAKAIGAAIAASTLAFASTLYWSQIILMSKLNPVPSETVQIDYGSNLKHCLIVITAWYVYDIFNI